MDVFRAVKDNVTARQVAEYYGMKIGRNGMACCPFHDDKHPRDRITGAADGGYIVTT